MLAGASMVRRFGMKKWRGGGGDGRGSCKGEGEEDADVRARSVAEVASNERTTSGSALGRMQQIADSSKSDSPASLWC